MELLQLPNSSNSKWDGLLRRQVSVEQYGEQMLHTFQVVNKEKQSTIELDYVDLQFKLLN